jgi:hypothetical protein
MKKILVLLCMFTSCSLFAQHFSGGVLCGLNASQVDGDTYARYNKFGIAIGAYVYTPISKIMDIQLEIKYMGKGAQHNASDSDPNQYTNQLNYIEIPIILRLKTNTKIDVEGGLGYGYLFNNTMKDAYGSYDADGIFKKSDLLGLIGVKYTATDKLSITMRFSYSLSTIRDGLGNGVYFRNGGVYNNVLSIGLFYELNTKQE